MPSTEELERIEAALKTDRTIDIVTTGAKTDLARTTEIWFTNIDGRIILCGTPHGRSTHGPISRRDWLANLIATPAFRFCFKESLKAQIPAKAIPVQDPADRSSIMSAPETRWYREQGFSVDDLVVGSPIVDVVFLGEYDALNRR